VVENAHRPNRLTYDGSSFGEDQGAHFRLFLALSGIYVLAAFWVDGSKHELDLKTSFFFVIAISQVKANSTNDWILILYNSMPKK
jgi:hypothetical protein